MDKIIDVTGDESFCVCDYIMPLYKVSYVIYTSTILQEKYVYKILFLNSVSREMKLHQLDPSHDVYMFCKKIAPCVFTRINPMYVSILRLNHFTSGRCYSIWNLPTRKSDRAKLCVSCAGRTALPSILEYELSSPKWIIVAIWLNQGFADRSRSIRKTLVMLRRQSKTELSRLKSSWNLF